MRRSLGAQIDRRGFTLGGMGAAMALSVPAVARKRTDSMIWTFDSLDRIGGVAAHAEGHPTLVDSAYGRAMSFNGIDDMLFVEAHPFAGAARFTFEVLFRPEGGAFAQRWFHIESKDPGTGMKPGDTRCLFEIRVHGDQWCLDAFLKGPSYSQPLIADTKLYPLNQWYHVAQSCDGTAYRSYVNGDLQAEHAVAFTPQGPGRASVGARINRVDHFRGLVKQARFTPDALTPDLFWRPPAA